MTGPGRPRKPGPKRRANGAGTHYVDERGKHVIQGTVPGVGRRKVRADSEAEAWIAFEQLKRDAERFDLTSKTPTVGQLAETWLSNYERGEAEGSTISTKIQRVRLHILGDARLAGIRASSLKPADVEAWLDRKIARGWTTSNGKRKPYSPTSIRDFRLDLSQIVEWGIRRRTPGLDWNPVKHIDKVRLEESGALKRSLTPDQARRLIEECVGSERRYAGYALAVLTLGARPGEIAGLTWGQINFDTGEVVIDRAIKRRSGGVPIGLGETKTKKHRTLYATDLLLAALKREAERQDDERHPEWPAQWDGLVFRSRLGNPPNRSNLLRALRWIVEDAGLDMEVLDFTNYELRHTCASLLDHAGVPVNEIIDQLGHADDRMFYRHYRHKTDPVSGRAAVAVWGQLLGATAP